MVDIYGLMGLLDIAITPKYISRERRILFDFLEGDFMGFKEGWTSNNQ